MSNETKTAEDKQPAQPPVAKVRIGLITGPIDGPANAGEVELHFQQFAQR